MEVTMVNKIHCNSQLFITLLSVLASHFLVIEGVYNGKICATLHSDNDPLRNNSLKLKDGNVIGNLAGEYISGNVDWNTTSYWRVDTGCELNTCDEVYLSGRCHQISGGNTSPTQRWLSAGCSCSRDCSCSDVVLRNSVCAHAYFGPSGCDTCNAEYTQFKQESEKSFTETWAANVKALFVRNGCTLTIYDEEDFDGEEEEIEGSSVLKEWTGNIGSYECICRSDTISEQPGTDSGQGETTSTSEVEIPVSLDDVIDKFQQHNYDHPALLAAITSLTNRHSSRNAYVLVIGSTGAGKSTAINILLGKSNLTVAGEHQSTTSQILEFRLPVPLKNGMKNSELRIIDTPGLGDTRGIEKDSEFLATLDDYLSNHDELQNKLPNLVLVFHKFTDNRFDGDGAPFVNMIRGLNSLRSKITDDKYSNILFVFSHFCSVKEYERNPAPRLFSFTEVIRKYGLFPKPISTAVVENKGQDHDLVMINNNFRLPNHEFFPQNLLHKFDMITSKRHDAVGNAVVVAGFSGNFEFANVKHLIQDLVSSAHNKVAKYLGTLTSAAFNVRSTEVSGMLEEAFNANESLKNSFPQSLQYLQIYFNVRNIRSKTDLPQTTTSILELLKDIDLNEATLYLLNQGLDLKLPSFSINTVAGYSYSITQDEILTASPFRLDDKIPSPIGFAVPIALKVSKSATRPVTSFKIFTTKEEYFAETIQPVAESQFFKTDPNIFKGKIRDGYFVTDTSCNENESSVCTFIVTKLYKRFQFALDWDKPQTQLTTEFAERLAKMSKFEQSDLENVQNWKDLFRDYGTHVVTEAAGGGRIDIQFSLSPTTPVNETVVNVLKYIEYLENPLTAVLKFRETPKTILSSIKEIEFSLVFRGGNPACHISDLTKQNIEEGAGILKNWQKSLDFYPVVFPTKLEPMFKVLEKCLSGQVENVKEAYDRLLNSTLNYIPPPPPTPDPAVVAELERQRLEQEEQVRRLEEEKRRLEEQAERDRLAALEAQRRREEEELEKAEKRRREQQEAEERHRIWEDEQRRVQRQLEEQRRREQAAAHRRHLEHMAWLREQERLQRERMWREQWQREEEARRRRSCLKEGTKILMADFTEKPVDKLEVGDIVLDMDLKPTRVLGVSYEFLLDQKFHGFDNRSFFFTDTHLFVGAPQNIENDDRDTSDIKLYTTSTPNLFAQNPLMRYLNVHEFENSTGLIYYDRVASKTPVERNVIVFQDLNHYPMTTLIYYIQVDSLSGTYFAEGFVCRHEIPPFEMWPNTMATLFSLFGTPGFNTIEKMSYSLETIAQINQISDNVKNAVDILLRNDFPELSTTNYSVVKGSRNYWGNARKCSQLQLTNFNLDNLLGKVFGNPTLATLGMELYGASGSIMSLYLDNPHFNLSDCQLKEIQENLIVIIQREMEHLLYKLYHQDSRPDEVPEVS